MTAEAIDIRGRLVFLVGARRSGTNWLHDLMAIHPAVLKVPSETHLFYTLAKLQERFQHGLLGSANTGSIYLPREAMLDSFRDLSNRAFTLQLSAARGDPRLLVERTPLHAQHLDLIAEVYPEAPVVHLIRDGHDVARSLVKQPWGPTTLEAAAQEWVDTVTKARVDRPPRYLEVRHEDLVADVATTMQGVWGFLGLDAPPNLVERLLAVADRPVNRSPGVDGSVADAAQQAEIEAVAGGLLRELGYPVGESVPTSPVGGAREGRERRRWSRRGGPAPAPQRSPTGDEVQHAIDCVLAAITAGDVDDLAARLSPTVEVCLRQTGRVLRGDQGLGALASTLIEETRPLGRQVRGDTFAGRPSFTVVWAHDQDGTVRHQVFVVAVGDDLKVTRIDHYSMGPTAG